MRSMSVAVRLCMARISCVIALRIVESTVECDSRKSSHYISHLATSSDAFNSVL